MVARQNMIERKARDMARKTAAGDRLTVEFSSEPPALTPGAARAVLHLLLKAREKQISEKPDTGTECAPG
ncbi:MAG TPA: hypothetical protein VNL16_09470 [Chloroflexota bacterium]|nr:hypothetical protein [Chloroflexota bacterium]